MNLRHRIAALASVAVLGLAACGGSDSDGGDVLDTPDVTTTEAPAPVETPVEADAAPVATEPPATDPPATEPPATEPPAPEPPAPEPEPTEPPTTPAPPTTVAPDPAEGDEPAEGEESTDAEPSEPADPGDAASCIEGAWIIDSEQLNSYYSALAANSGAGITFGAEGVVNVSFFDGVYQYAADFGITLDVAGTEGSGTATGTVSGTYEVADSIITATTDDSSLNVTITVAGVTMDGSDLGNDLITSAPINNAPIVCGAPGEGPTLLFQSGPSVDQRHPVVLKAF